MADSVAPTAPVAAPRPLTFGKIFGTARPVRRPEAPAEIAPPARETPVARTEIVAPTPPVFPAELEKPEADLGSAALVVEAQAPAEKMAPPAVAVEDAASSPSPEVEIEPARDTALVEAVRAGSAGGQVAMALALAAAARAAMPEPAGISLEKVGPAAGKRPGFWVTLIQVGAKGFKVGLVTVLLLGGIIYFARSWVVPVAEELLHPGAKNMLHDKGAPTAVRVLQQTRSVVAQNNARVDAVNAIVNGEEARTPAATPAPPKPVAVAPAPGRLPAPPSTETYQEAVDQLKVTGVFDGDNPRVYLNGLIVQYGQIVDRTLGLRFIGIDTADHAVVFSNADNAQFKKHY